MFLLTKAGHDRGPPQQTYYWGSILLMNKWKNAIKHEKTYEIKNKNMKKYNLVMKNENWNNWKKWKK